MNGVAGAMPFSVLSFCADLSHALGVILILSECGLSVYYLYLVCLVILPYHCFAFNL